MLLIVLLVSVMFYAVVARHVFERPTLWANELSLWMASFIFLLAGLYAMQQCSQIRIFLLFDQFPRWRQRVCDTVSTLLILTFSLAMIWGGYKAAHDQILRWETFGTAFDPPTQATLKPLVLILLAIGMPLGFASAVLAEGVRYMKFGPDFLFSTFGSGPLNIPAQRVYGLLTDYVLISLPLFMFMANLLERSGIAGETHSLFNIWLSRTRGGIAIVTSIMAAIMAVMSGIIGGEVVLLGRSPCLRC